MGKETSPCLFLAFHFPSNPDDTARRGDSKLLPQLSYRGRTLPAIPKANHTIDPNLISPAAVRVTRRLQDSGYEAYIVGGAVRDLLLGAHPKDFDVATNATPEQIKGLFRSSRIIGRRFQIVHVRDGREIIEVTTYRGPHGTDDAPPATSRQSDKGLLLRDNVYGTLEEDTARRDLTINAMYYDPSKEVVLDQLAGCEDLQARLIRIIGDPKARYREDPVRMLRVIRFAAKLSFDIEPRTKEAIRECAPLLQEIPAARLFDEFLKLFMAGHGNPTFHMLLDHDLLLALCPSAAEAITKDPSFKGMVSMAMANTDQRVKDGRPVTPAFLLAALLWPAVKTRASQLTLEDMPPSQAINSAGQQVTAETCQSMSIPKRFSIPMREIWELQVKLERQQKRRLKDILAGRRFRAAYDLLLLRAQAGHGVDAAASFWTEQQRLHPDLVGSAKPTDDKQHFKRRRPRRRKPDS